MSGQSAPKILCIDDDPNDLFLTKAVLEKAGYRVATARNGEQALDVLVGETVHLVLSDHFLCGATGSEIARRIKELHPDIFVVLFSGVVEPPADSREHTDMFINKDAGPDHLLERIAFLLSRNGEDRHLA